MAVAKYYKNWSEEDSGIDVFNRCMYMKLHICMYVLYNKLYRRTGICEQRFRFVKKYSEAVLLLYIILYII